MGEKYPEPNYYAVLTADVRYDPDLSSSEKIFFAEITALSNKEGVCWASNGYFADLYGVAKSTVSSWVKSLRAKKYIEVDYVRDKKEIKKRLIRPVTTSKTSFEAFEGVQLSEYPYSENAKGGTQKIEGGYSENPKDNITSMNNTRSNIKGEQEKLFEEEDHPLVRHINDNYKRIAKMSEPLTNEEAMKIMHDFKAKYPDLFPDDRTLKIELDRVLDELNNHKATSKNINANKTIRKWFNNHIDWHMIPDKGKRGTGKQRLFSIKEANDLFLANFTAQNNSGTDFDQVFEHVEGEGKHKKYRIRKERKGEIKNWNVIM